MFSDLLKIIAAPRKTARALVKKNDIFSVLIIVLTISLISSGITFITYLTGAYPPDPQTLQLWIDSYGKFGILPIINIPLESYRLFLAIITTPLIFSIWILMAGSAYILSIIFHGRATLKQYLILMGHSFFVFYIILGIVDMIYSGLLGNYENAILKLEYGRLIRDLVIWFPMIIYPSILGLGGVFNGIVTQEIEKYSFLKTLSVTILTTFWPVLLISLFAR